MQREGSCQPGWCVWVERKKGDGQTGVGRARPTRPFRLMHGQWGAIGGCRERPASKGLQARAPREEVWL